ncbi:unnamed protein product [Cercopithifilaria johnstoni]|uniref:Palmitoyltransferase n=1 Tax=Cercopithifilaria johnstoni TaxID=2874296 RepID=A0A8J2M858_9BILA|nr:unnamed protein product [Cercopithifilaria johnstoni]
MQLQRRHNGWSWPPSFFQLLFWIIIPVLASSTAFLLIPLHILYAPLTVFTAAIWLILQIIVLTCIDPAVSNLRKGQAPAYFDATKHEHVIENLFCNICLINVDPNCKHCRQCNKCISGFDHHCKWLNNCIGSANYRLFLLLVLSVCFISVLISICLIVLAVISFINFRLLPDSDKLPIKLMLWRGLCIGASVPYSIAAVLCAHLLYFHYKLWRRGMTTYYFIRNNKKCKNNQQQQQQQQQENQKQKKNHSVNAGLTPIEKTCSKLSIIKSRSIHDSNITNPYVFFPIQESYEKLIYTMLILKGCVFLLFLIVSAQRSQFDANCPRLCHCNKTTVECHRTKIQGSEIFLNIRPEAYPDLDTIIVTGNSIGDLAGWNIFGVNVTHRHVSLVNLSNNAINAIDSYTFRGLPAVEYFYLHNNAIERIGADPFRWNVRLRVLDISNFFSSSILVTERPRLLANTFADSVNEFNDLQELIVRDNALTEILPDTFCKLNGLIRLHLSDNKMKKFNFKSDCLQNLVVLDLSGNEISTLSIHLWEVLPSLTTVDISSNPLNCNCDILPAIKELSRSPTSSINQGYAICAAPESRKGQNIFQISDFTCKNNHRFIYWILFVLLLFAAMIFCRIYRNRMKLKHLPLVAGYSKLGEENEQFASSPQFV